MRDDVKAGLFFAGILAVFTVVTKYYNPVVWDFAVNARSRENVLRQASAPRAPAPPAGLDDFIAAYGPATGEEGTALNRLRPPMAAKWLDYEPEHLRVAFVAADDGGDPPRRQWTAISYMDSIEARPLSPEEAYRRLRGRER